MAQTKSMFSKFEEEMLETWEKEKTFEQSLKQREGKPYFSFYDGPPFANGLPHYGHVVPGTIKDAIARYKTMQGYYVPRKAGWDTHGLPVEYDVEKQLKISGKKQILELGVDKFNQICRDSVFRYKNEFESFINRMGRWLDLDNGYATLDDSYIESVWWVVSQLHQKNLLYRSLRSMPYCPRCATPLSNFELNQGYQDDIKDPSVYVNFPLVDDAQTALLAWTTTPWTLPANAALAVDEQADYVTAELKGQPQRLILAKKLVESVLKNDEYTIVKTQKGHELVGVAYQPLYPIAKEATAYKVYPSEAVSLEDGTGILHVAPRYGELDLELGLKHQLPLIESVDANGFMTNITPIANGKFFKAADPDVIADLTKKERLFAVDDSFTHTYPFCWRCDTPLLYFATPTWNVAVTRIVKDLVANNKKINWVPDHIKDGRFGNWLAEARDWGISRNRFWGAPLPIWVNEQDQDDLIVVSSLAQLQELSARENFDLHRPGIDQVVIKRAGKTYRRVEEVLDCWFESGSMPYGQDHYPFENEAHFSKGFPADFISEGLDQTRGWFYTLHVLGTALFNKPAYKNVICHGIVVAADGKKLSKRLRNYPPLDEVFDTYGADVLRFFMLNSPVVMGEEVRFSADHLKDTQRNVFLTWWNVFSFFKTYTNIDGWSPSEEGITDQGSRETKSFIPYPSSENILDRWIAARLNQTIGQVTQAADTYQLARAARPLVEFIDDLSNWYVRRSRRRFWKSEDDQDKTEAYATLYFVLLRLSQLLAPWAPFLSDKIYRELRDSNMPASVHLTDWPHMGQVNTKLLTDMQQVREIITEGLAQRADAGIKVRQPLASATIPKVDESLIALVAEELNVKQITSGRQVKVDINVTPDLMREGLAREAIRHVQQYRKELNLEVSDRIQLGLGTDNAELKEALQAFGDLISAETLATKLDFSAAAASAKPASIEGKQLHINIKKT